MNRKLSKSIIGVFAGAVMLTTAIAPAGAAEPCPSGRGQPPHLAVRGRRVG